MNATIANIILDRIVAEDLPWIDKTAGLARAITFTKQGETRTWPIACTVDDPLACEDSTLAELLPEDKYASVLFFEGDTFPQRIKDRIQGVHFVSRLRIVVWMNCKRLGGSCSCGDLAAQNLITAIEGRKYATGDFTYIKHTVVGGGPMRGADIFGKYTLNEVRSQYLHYPFDFFALDIETTFRLAPGCEEKLALNDVDCWTPPGNGRKLHPNQFTCEQLLDPEYGLTEEQLGPDCLDCNGEGPCDPLTYQLRDEDGNLLDSGIVTDPCGDNLPLVAPNGNVLRDGVQYGTVLSGGEIDVPSNCECDPLTATLNGVEIINEADPCGVDVALECSDLVDAVVVEGAGAEGANGLYRLQSRGTTMVWRKDDNWILSYNLDIPEGFGSLPAIEGLNPTEYESESVTASNSANAMDGMTWVSGTGDSPAPTVRQATIADLCPCTPCDPCEDAVVQLKDTAGNNIGSPDSYAAGSTSNKTAPDAAYQLKDSAGTNIGSAGTIRSNASADITAPDGTVTAKNSATTSIGSVSVKSNGAADLSIADSTITKPDGTTVGLPATVSLDVRNYRSGIAYQGGKGNWSGQSTVYRTGDEGTAFAGGLYAFTRPLYPVSYAELGATFYLLAANNFAGNTNRFTARDGSAYATSGDRIVRDNLTGWEYYIPGTLTTELWNAKVDAGVAINATLGETGWYLCPIDLLDTLADLSLGAGCLNHTGFLLGNPVAVWSSTTMNSDTTNAFSFFSNAQRPANQAKASISNIAIFCKRFAA